MKKFKTDQEEFWAGQFGDEYVGRNHGQQFIASNMALFSRILSRTRGVQSVIEFGANIGLNLIAMRNLSPSMELSAIEINACAVEQLNGLGDVKVYPQSILDFECDYQRDLALIKGVLIHINPESLPQVYDLLYQTSKRYICIAEYYNPTPVEVTYRGHAGKLFKRDFAGEMLKRFSGLQLVDYGFVYHGDPNFPMDDETWFLLEKAMLE
ncbi:MAG: pseudaminic acid biosynthesis-associated methylase [Negativicutes bacterium]|nr:pseudaminic acid biosynthesis-associated methylase [Negativicutes bacterium]